MFLGDAFIALGGKADLTGTIDTNRLQEIMKNQFELNNDPERLMKKVTQNKTEINFDEFVKFFQ